MLHLIVAHVDFLDGIRRSVYEEPNGRQQVHENVGERVYGGWFMPCEGCDRPIIVDDRPF